MGITEHLSILEEERKNLIRLSHKLDRCKKMMSDSLASADQIAKISKAIEYNDKLEYLLKKRIIFLETLVSDFRRTKENVDLLLSDADYQMNKMLNS